MVGSFSHTFNVDCKTQEGEVVALTGSSADLGQWKRGGVIPMARTHPDSNVWTLPLELSDDTEHQYRYCVVVILQPCSNHNQRKIIVRRWETHLLPRNVRHRSHEEIIDTFGEFDGKKRIQRGWLAEEMLVQFKLGPSAITLYKKKHCRPGIRRWVKVTPLGKHENAEDVSQEISEESLDIQDVRSRLGGWPIVEAAAMSDKNCNRQVQDQYGLEYTYSDNESSFLCFETQILNSASTAFLVDIYSRVEGQSDEDPPDHVGMCYIYPDNLKHTIGTISIPITSMKFQPIGKLTVDYLVTHPTPGFDLDFSVSLRNYWSDDWKGLDVGHRGLGNSYTKGHHCSTIKENTIASMRDAIQHGADMVEFDVQVSRDLVPILFHEFRLCVQTRTKEGGELMLDIPVRDLSLPELQRLKIHHPSEKQDGVKMFGNEGHEDHEPFPTLEDVLGKLDQHCGFNIEIKYGQLMKDDQEEDKNPMEMNIFLDQILKTVLKHGAERKIIFSSFNPDICTMIINKQNKYPVLLLTAGENSKYDDFKDPRTWSIKNGVLFGEMSGLLGLSAMAEAVTKDVSQLEMIHKYNQIIFVWTDEQNDKDTVKYLKQLGVNGVIYDRMDQNNDKVIKESIFMTSGSGKQDNMSSSGVSSTGSDYSPISSPDRSPPRPKSGLSFGGLFQNN